MSSNTSKRTLAIPTTAPPALPEGWRESTVVELYAIDEVEPLVEANRKLGALKRYVQRKEDKDDVAVTEIECRGHIGDLLGPNPGSGGDHSSLDSKLAAANLPLSKIERYEFRLLAENRKVYRSMIAGGEYRYRPIIQELQRRRRTDKSFDLPPDVDITLGAVADLRIEAGSVDLIVTDPPYGSEHLSVWEDLAGFAKGALRPGGLLIAYSGQLFLPEALWALSDLEYVWVGAIVHDGPFFQFRNHKIQVGWKPLLIFGQPPVHITRWWNDTITDGRREKDFHGWQQAEAEAASLIESFTVPGDLIVDPFLGGGTTAAAAVKTGRRFIGCDVDPEAIKRTEARIAI